MKRPFMPDRYTVFLKSRGIDLNAQQLHQLATFHNLLLHWSRRQNLIAAGDRSNILDRHIMPSICFSEIVNKYNPRSVIDVGSGAGFPGIVLKIIKPQLSVRVVDSSRKKCLFLTEVCEQLNLNCQIVQNRVEQLLPSQQKDVDIVVARYVGEIGLIWKWTASLIKPGGHLIMQTGTPYDGALIDANWIKTLRPDSAWKTKFRYLSSKYFIVVEKKNA